MLLIPEMSSTIQKHDPRQVKIKQITTSLTHIEVTQTSSDERRTFSFMFVRFNLSHKSWVSKVECDFKGVIQGLKIQCLVLKYFLFHNYDA